MSLGLMVLKSLLEMGTPSRNEQRGSTGVDRVGTTNLESCRLAGLTRIRHHHQAGCLSLQCLSKPAAGTLSIFSDFTVETEPVTVPFLRAPVGHYHYFASPSRASLFSVMSSFCVCGVTTCCCCCIPMYEYTRVA